MSEPKIDARFHPLFERWARRVRGRLAARRALTGAAAGLAIAAAVTAALWWSRLGALRPYTAALALVGVAAGLVFAYRRRWSDSDVALYLDDRLGTDETIATAVELRNDAELDDPARAVVVSSAANALASSDPRKARPRVLRLAHAAIPAFVGLIAWLAVRPLPPAPVVASDPGTTKVQVAQADGLAKVAKLSQLEARDDAQRERLDKIAKDAEKLKQDLEKGLEKREAQDRIAKLQDQIAAERLSLGSGEQRAGHEAAVSKLQESDLTKKAAKALGDHDLQTMDSEMEKLANQREKADRELAQKKIAEAADAAKKNGAPDTAKALEQEKEALARRGQRADMLRDLAKGMKQSGTGGDDVQNKSSALDREGTDKAAEALAQSMADALEKMTPEERERLAKKLGEMNKGGGGAKPMDPDQLKDMAKDLSTPEGKKKLEQQLKDLAKEDNETAESKRQKGLDDAQGGAGDTQKDVDKQGQGQQGQQGQGQQGQGQQGQGQQGQGQQGQGQQGQGQQGQGQQGQGQQGQGQGQGQQGQGNGNGQGQVPIPIPNGGNNSGNGNGSSHGSHDQGTGDHRGSTNPVDAQTMKSRASGPMNKSNAMPGSVTAFTPGKAGGTANTRGTGDLRAVGPQEVDGVDRSEVPEEYRDQVRQYFQP
jgi:hypothetical protein